MLRAWSRSFIRKCLRGDFGNAVSAVEWRLLVWQDRGSPHCKMASTSGPLPDPMWYCENFHSASGGARMDAQTACPVRGSWLWVIEDQKEKGSFPVCRTLSTWPPLFHKSANFPSRGEARGAASSTALSEFWHPRYLFIHPFRSVICC